MRSYLSTLTPKQEKIFKEVDRILRKTGSEGRLVGGAVRDLLRGIVPKDLDVATPMLPEEVMRAFSGLWYHEKPIKVVPTGISHGTVTVILDDLPVEVTTLRVDKDTDGRHAEVEYTDDWELDASRRDFTVNAMYMDSSGTLYDYFEGFQDLKNGIIQFVGNPQKRIEEDALRILRFYRFFARLYTPEVTGWDHFSAMACAENLHLLAGLSGERIWSELVQIVGGPGARDMVDAFVTKGVFEACGFPKLLRRPGWTTDPYFDGRTALYRLADVLYTIEDLDVIRERLKFDTNSYKVMKYIIENRNDAPTLASVKAKLAEGEDRELLKHLCTFLRVGDALSWLETQSLPKFPVSGNDVKDLGFSGPIVGEKLKVLRAKWIESGYEATKERLLESLQ